MTFSYEILKEKAKREIDRLKNAEQNNNDMDAIDHALNAAFTIYHLLEWEDNCCPKKSLYACRGEERKNKTKSSHADFDLIDAIVTCQKHMTIRNHYKEHLDENARTANFNVEKMYTIISTEDVIPLCTEDMRPICQEGYTIKVYFGEKNAVEVLENSFALFS